MKFLHPGRFWQGNRFLESLSADFPPLQSSKVGLEERIPPSRTLRRRKWRCWWPGSRGGVFPTLPIRPMAKTGLAGLAFWASCFGRDQRPRKSVSPTCHRHVFRLPFCGFRTLSRRLLMAKRPEIASRGVSFLKYAHRQDEPRKAASQWKHPLISRCGWRPKLVNEPKRAQNCPESGLAIRNDGAN